MHNIFVLGLDEAKRAELRALPDAQNLRFHQLLSVDELRHGKDIPIRELLQKAQDQLESFNGEIDAIVGYWDFPVTQMVPILCRQFGLHSASLRSVLKCEHKYWSRLEQRRSIEEVPAFGVLDPDDENPQLPEGMEFPVWLKPVKSASSASAHHVDDQEELRSALTAERDQIGRMGEPFSYVLSLVDLPDEVDAVGGTSFLVEEEATGDQVTVEGFSTGREIEVYGIVDSYTYLDSPSFLRYQYPSRLPAAVTERMADVSRRVISHIGLENTTFNIEYFWDSERDALRLLEINPRHSQSHAKLFQMVDGTPNHACMIDLALGREPALPHREGPYAVAATWFPRRFTDAVVRRSPTSKEIHRIQHEIPGTTIQLVAEGGDRLSDIPDQDSYSVGLANIQIGAADEAELVDKYERCLAALPFEFDHPDKLDVAGGDG